MKIVSGQERVARAAIEELVRRNLGSVRGYLAVLGCPPHLRDDLVQDVFLSMLSSRFEDRGQASTSAFLRKVARHLYLKALERERRQRALSELAEGERAWLYFERDDLGDSYLGALRECLTSVRSRARSVLELRYRERLAQADIAARLGLSEAGVNSILVRTRKSLRACIERRLAS